MNKQFLVEVRIIDTPSGDMDDWKPIATLVEEINSDTASIDCQDLAERMKYRVQLYVDRTSSDTKAADTPKLVPHLVT